MLLLFGGSYPLPELLLTVLEEPPDDGLPVELPPELDVPDGLLPDVKLLKLISP